MFKCKKKNSIDYFYFYTLIIFSKLYCVYDLPEEIRLAESATSLKPRLKTHFYNLFLFEVISVEICLFTFYLHLFVFYCFLSFMSLPWTNLFILLRKLS